MSAKTNALRNYTFLLPPDLMEKLRRHAADLGMPSLDEAARVAFEAYIKELDRSAYRTAMQKAANDPAFRRDVEDTMRDFGRIDHFK